MVLLVLSFVLALIANFWLAAKVWRVNAFYGILSFFFFPAAIPFMYAYWDDEEHGIKLVFVVTVLASTLWLYQLDTLGSQVL